MIYITDRNELNLKKSKLVLYFYAPWMMGHKRMLKMIQKVENKYPFTFYAINVDIFPEIPKKLNVESIPTVLYLKRKKIKKTINGLVLTSAFVHVFAQLAAIEEGEKENGTEREDRNDDSVNGS